MGKEIENIIERSEKLISLPDSVLMSLTPFPGKNVEEVPTISGEKVNNEIMKACIRYSIMYQSAGGFNQEDTIVMNRVASGENRLSKRMRFS